MAEKDDGEIVLVWIDDARVRALLRLPLAQGSAKKEPHGFSCRVRQYAPRTSMDTRPG